MLLTTFVVALLPLLTLFLLSFVGISSQPLQLPSPTLIVCTTLTPLLNTWSPLSIIYASRPHQKLHYPSLCLVKLSQVLNDTMLSPCFYNGNSQLSSSSCQIFTLCAIVMFMCTCNSVFLGFIILSSLSCVGFFSSTPTCACILRFMEVLGLNLVFGF